MEFRQNFYIRLITQFFFVALQLVIVSVFFGFTENLGSWTKNEVYALIGIFRLIEGAFHVFLLPNILGLPELINEGELDLLLSKPANPLFFISLKRQQLYEISTFLSGLIILWFTHLIYGLNWVNTIILAFLGLISLYDTMLLFSTLSFYIPRLTALGSFWDIVSKTSRFPLDIFSKSSSAVFYIIAPLFLIVTLPAQIVLGKLPNGFYVVQVVGVVIFSAIAYGFWQFSLRRYSSASS